LWARRITLRHRAEEGEDGKWTLKIPAEEGGGGVARTEWTWKAPIDALPAEARAESGVVGELQIVVTMTAERRRVQLANWGEIDDDLVTVTTGPRAGMRFRQIELELIGRADPGAVEAVLNALGQAGATPGGGVKFARAAGLE
jgi:inorganic triphosphatase YgiF